MVKQLVRGMQKNPLGIPLAMCPCRQCRPLLSVSADPNVAFEPAEAGHGAAEILLEAQLHPSQTDISNVCKLGRQIFL